MAVKDEVPSIGLLGQHPFTVVIILFTIYSLGLGFYRLVFHPLAKFPGPRLAGLSYWYEIYYDVYKPGEYTAVIRDLHQKYGPIIRINPDEIHVSDPKFIETLYPSTGKKREISPWFFRSFGFEGTHFGTPNHDTHRMRRAPLSRFFSKAMVGKLEPVIKENAVKYCENLKSWSGTNQPLNLITSISCFATDVITGYLFGTSYNYLDDPKMEKSLYQPIHVGSEATIIFKHFPLYMQLFLAIPTSIMTWMDPDAERWRVFRLDARSHVRKVKKDIEDKVPRTRTTIFHDLLEGNLPESEKGTERLGREAQAMLGAGMETTSWSLSVNLFHLLSSPSTMAKLRTELEAAIPSADPNTVPSWSTLEQLPYLNACVHEGLRLGYGVASRLARISPDEPMIYNGPDKTWSIPPGYAVGMSSYIVHHDESIFHDSKKYMPERWLDDDGKISRNLEQYLLSFSKGSRGCLGMNLAWAELFIFLAMIVRCYGDRLELFKTTLEDVEFHHDAFIPGIKPGTKGVRVLVN
ncbi:Cytochrome P450 [Neofusicoccum parvum]|nr:Cytochrome P450 [Neofusicoccum parvum]